MRLSSGFRALQLAYSCQRSIHDSLTNVCPNGYQILGPLGKKMFTMTSAASIWFEIWEVVDPGKKFPFFQANFRKISIFSRKLTKNFHFPGKLTNNFDFSKAN